jgi:hypothetical protein
VKAGVAVKVGKAGELVACVVTIAMAVESAAEVLATLAVGASV